MNENIRYQDPLTRTSMTRTTGCRAQLDQKTLHYALVSSSGHSSAFKHLRSADVDPTPLRALPQTSQESQWPIDVV